MLGVLLSRLACRGWMVRVEDAVVRGWAGYSQVALSARGSECDVGGARVPERVVKASNASSDASTGVDATGIESTGVKKRQWFGRGQAQDEATD